MKTCVWRQAQCRVKTCMETGTMGNQWILKALVVFLSMEGLVREKDGDVLSML